MNTIFVDEKTLKNINQMEEIYERAQQKLNALEKALEEYEQLQSDIKKLEAYYTSQQWKDDFALDEKGVFPDDLKRGILSEDGIYNLLEQNKELLDRIGLDESDVE